MNLRHLKLWKREPKPDSVLRSPSSDSGYSDLVPSHMAKNKLKSALATTERSRNPDAPSAPAPHDRGACGGPQGCHAASKTRPTDTKQISVEKFMEYIREKDLTSIQSAIREDSYDLETKDQVGRTALHHALLNGIADNNLSVFCQLLLYGANPNAKDDTSERETVLHMAIRLEHLEATKIILESPAIDVNACNSHIKKRMLPERCIIEDVHRTNADDMDATQRKRRSYGEQYFLCVRRDASRCIDNHFPPLPARETVRDMIVVHGEGRADDDWLGEAIRRLEIGTLKVLCLVDCSVAFDALVLLVSAPLRVLVLSYCGLRAVPYYIFEIATLEVLKIDHNCVDEIPEEIGNLSRLRTFCCDAQRPRLRSLPESISRLERLEVLSFCDNRVDSIGWSGTLPNLRVLRCASNRIDRLPPQLVNLSQLTWLDVSHNPIERVPRTLVQFLPRLYRFDYANLRLQPRGARRSRSALMAHLRLEAFLAGSVQQESIGTCCVSDMTIVVLGESGSGKSTLLHALKDERGLCRQEPRNFRRSLEICSFDMHSTALENGISGGGGSEPVRQAVGTPSSGESPRGTNFSVNGGDDPASCHVTGVTFSGEYLDNYTRDVRADLYLVLLDLTALDQHHTGSPPHLLVRHLGRLQMWLEAAYEMSPSTPALIVGTHADLVKTVTAQDVCCLLDELLACGRHGHVRRFSDDVSRNCVLCGQRPLGGHVTLPKSRSGQSWILDLPSPTPNPARSGSQRASSSSVSSPPDSNGGSNTCGKPRYPHVIGYHEVDCKRCYPRDSKKINASVDQLRALILRLTESRHRIPVEWTAFGRQLVGLSEQTQGVPCLSFDDAVSVARNFEISESLVPLILSYFHRRGSVVFFPGETILSRLVVVNPVWLLDKLERLLSAQPSHQTDGIRFYQRLCDRELDRLFLKAHIQGLSGTQWLTAVAERLEYCAPLARPTNSDHHSSSSFFFPRLLRYGSPAIEVWREVPELNERQVAFDVTVRNSRPRMFPEFLLALNDEGRRELEILSSPIPVYLSHQVVLFSSLDTGPCGDCRNSCDGGSRRTEGYLDPKIDDVLHKVNIAFHASRDTVQVIVRGPRPCCAVKSVMRFLDQHLNDEPDDLSDPDNSASSSYRSCSCASSDDSSLCVPRDLDADRSVSLLCPKCVLLGDWLPDRISAQTMTNSRNKPVCNKWHNLGSWSRAVTGDYQFTVIDRPFYVSPVRLPDYEHPRLVMLLPPSAALSRREWLGAGRTEFLDGYEVQFLCENFTHWHLADGSGIRLRSRPSGDSALSALVALATPMVQLVLGIGEHPTTPRLLAPVVTDLLRTYDYLRLVDASTQDAYSWLLRYKDRLAAMLARVLASVSSVDGGPQQHPDVFLKTGTTLGPSDLLQSTAAFSREELGRFLQLETTSSRFGCLRPVYLGREVRWVCETHYEEFRATPTIHFNS